MLRTILQLCKRPGQIIRARQRKIDVDILWPLIRDRAMTLADARSAFYMHCIRDRSWTKDFELHDIVRQVEKLK